MHTSRSIAGDGTRSSVKISARAEGQKQGITLERRKLPLERTNCRAKYWEMKNHARAAKLPLERRSNNKEPARALKLPLERESQNLGINLLVSSGTILFQTCPTQPKTQIQQQRLEVIMIQQQVHGTKSGIQYTKEGKTGIAITLTIYLGIK